MATDATQTPKVLDEVKVRGQVTRDTIPAPTNRFSVDFFSQKFLSVDLARTSNFVVSLTPPGDLSIERYQEVAYLCSAAQMPGRRLTTLESKPHGYGPTIKTPYDSVFDDIELTFYVDADRASSLELFHRWINYIFVNSNRFPDIASVSRYKNSYIATSFNIFMISKYPGMADPYTQFASINEADIQQARQQHQIVTFQEIVMRLFSVNYLVHFQ
jgi:hypothetical protein